MQCLNSLTCTDYNTKARIMRAFFDLTFEWDYAIAYNSSKKSHYNNMMNPTRRLVKKRLHWYFERRILYTWFAATRY